MTTGEDVEQVFASFDHPRGDVHCIQVLLSQFPPYQREQALREAIDCAKQIVVEYQGLIERLASVLSERGRMDGAEVEAMLSEWVGQ